MIKLANWIWEGLSTEIKPTMKQGAQDGHVFKCMDSGESFTMVSGNGLYAEKIDAKKSDYIKKELNFEVPGTFVDVRINSQPGWKVFSKLEPIPPEYRLIK